MRPIKFRYYDKENKQMFCQGDPDLETLQSFIFHYGDQELMQFTGLYDEDGKEIYEGDIVKGNFNTPMQVYFSNGQFKANAIGKDQQGEITWHGHALENTEIIGNIHEHKHLLEE